MKKAVGHLIPFTWKKRRNQSAYWQRVEDEASHLVGACGLGGNWLWILLLGW